MSGTVVVDNDCIILFQDIEISDFLNQTVTLLKSCLFLELS